MLAHRRAVLSLKGPVPEQLKDIMTEQHQIEPGSAVLARGGTVRRGGGRGAGGRGGDRGDRDHKPRKEREHREHRAETSKATHELKEMNRAARSAEDPEHRTPGQEAAEQAAVSEEKLHLESLLNYVAFNRKEPQRTFLLTEEDLPPPPPPPKVRKVEEVPQQPITTTATADKANEEAQMVLLGAINFKRADVAKDIYGQLTNSGVAIFERTFKLIVEAAVMSQDLKSASDFLMKMEAAGFTPESRLLDKVMDLYSQHKQKRELKKQESAAMSAGPRSGRDLLQAYTMDVVPEIQGPRAKLSSQAAIFVPMCIPPPPPRPQVAEEPKSNAAQAASSEPSDLPEPERPEQCEAKPRTKLTACAKPFEPMCNVVFDPVMHTWLVGVPQPPPPPKPQAEAKNGKQKGESKPKAKAGGKGEQNVKEGGKGSKGGKAASKKASKKA